MMTSLYNDRRGIADWVVHRCARKFKAEQQSIGDNTVIISLELLRVEFQNLFLAGLELSAYYGVRTVCFLRLKMLFHVINPR